MPAPHVRRAAVRALLPVPSDEVDLVGAYEPPEGAGAARAFVRCNMISTFDGAVSVGGRSGGLGGPADRKVFQVLRSWADVVLVGAGTVRAERYGPARLSDELRARRLARGLPAVPAIAVVTRSGNLDWSSPLFTDAEVRPVVVTTRRDEGAVGRGRDVADVLVAGDDVVDLRLALEQLAGRAQRSVLLEGGPGLNAEVVAAGLLDELCLTFSPRLVAGSGPRVFAGSELTPPIGLDGVQLLEEDGFYFWRLALRPDRPRP